MYIVSEFSLSMVHGNVHINTKELQLKDVKEMKFESAISNKETAKSLSDILGREIKESDVNVKMGDKGDSVLVAQKDGDAFKFTQVSVGDLPMAITVESHLDHGIDGKLMSWVLKQCSEERAFFKKVLPHPEGHTPLKSGLHGPDCGDEPVLESEVTYEIRGTREWKSRMTNRPSRPAKYIKVIGGRDDHGQMVLYTLYGMMGENEDTPREPGDKYFAQPGKELEKEKSIQYWSVHALSK